MTWEQVTRAPDDELVAAYMRDGKTRAEAEATVAELRSGWFEDMVDSSPEKFQRLGMNPGPFDCMLWEMKGSDCTPAEFLAERKIRNVLINNRMEAHFAILDAERNPRGT